MLQVFYFRGKYNKQTLIAIEGAISNQDVIQLHHLAQYIPIKALC